MIITLCYPAPVSVSIDHVVHETGLVVSRSVAVPGVTVHLLHLFCTCTATRSSPTSCSGPLCVITACGEKEVEASRMGHGWEEKVVGV